MIEVKIGDWIEHQPGNIIGCVVAIPRSGLSLRGYEKFSDPKMEIEESERGIFLETIDCGLSFVLINQASKVRFIFNDDKFNDQFFRFKLRGKK